jgi:hypothetical protein
MSTAEKIWQAFTQVIKLTDKVSSLSGQVKELSSDIRAMDKRIVRLETALEIALSGRAIATRTVHPPKPAPPKHITSAKRLPKKASD